MYRDEVRKICSLEEVGKKNSLVLGKKYRGKIYEEEAAWYVWLIGKCGLGLGARKL